MTLTIINHDGTEEHHEVKAREFEGRSYLDYGITAIGFQFYSLTLKNFVLVHPQSVRQIKWGEEA